jgi:hypothetical protein
VHQIAEVHAKAGQDPAEAEREQHDRQQDDGSEKDRPRYRAQNDLPCGRQQEDADARVEQRRPKYADGEDLERENHLLHVIWRRRDECRRSRQALVEDRESRQPRKEHQAELQKIARAGPRPSCPEDDAEHEGVQGERGERRRERPEHTEQRASIPARDFPARQLARQMALGPEVGDEYQRIRET